MFSQTLAHYTQQHDSWNDRRLTRRFRFWKHPFINQGFAQTDVVRVVDCQKLDRGATDRRATQKQRALPLEMLSPRVLSRMEEPNQYFGVGVDACDVWAFVGIASVAAQAEIVGVRFPTVLQSDDVIDWEREEGIVVLMDAAVLAPITCPLADEAPHRGVHQAE